MSAVRESDGSNKLSVPSSPGRVIPSDSLAGAGEDIESDMPRWIKLWEHTFDDGWVMSLTFPQRWAWLGVLARVNWKASEWGCHRCGKDFQLPAGATAKTFRTLANLSGVGEHVMRGLLRKAVKKGNLKILDRARCHTLYVVVNWEKYQGVVTQASLSGHSGVTQASQEEESKNIKKKDSLPVRTKKKRIQCELPMDGTSYRDRDYKHDVDAVLGCYYEEYRDAHGREPEVDFRGKDRAIVKRLLKGPPMRTREQMYGYIQEYVALDDKFAREAGYPLALMPSKMNKLAGHRQIDPMDDDAAWAEAEDS